MAVTKITGAGLGLPNADGTAEGRSWFKDNRDKIAEERAKLS